MGNRNRKVFRCWIFVDMVGCVVVRFVIWVELVVNCFRVNKVISVV